MAQSCWVCRYAPPGMARRRWLPCPGTSPWTDGRSPGWRVTGNTGLPGVSQWHSGIASPPTVAGAATVGRHRRMPERLLRVPVLRPGMGTVGQTVSYTMMTVSERTEPQIFAGAKKATARHPVRVAGCCGNTTVLLRHLYPVSRCRWHRCHQISGGRISAGCP